MYTYRLPRDMRLFVEKPEVPYLIPLENSALRSGVLVEHCSFEAANLRDLTEMAVTTELFMLSQIRGHRFYLLCLEAFPADAPQQMSIGGWLHFWNFEVNRLIDETQRALAHRTRLEHEYEIMRALGIRSRSRLKPVSAIAA